MFSMDTFEHEQRHLEIDRSLTRLDTAVGIGKWLTTTLLAAAGLIVGIYFSRGGM